MDHLPNITFTQWLPDQVLCYKTGGYSSLNYLKSIGKKCDDQNICQYYFCKRNNDPKEKCPIVDIQITLGFNPSKFNKKHPNATLNENSDPTKFLKINSNRVKYRFKY